MSSLFGQPSVGGGQCDVDRRMAALAAKAVGSKKNGRNDNSSKTTEKRNGDAYIEHGNDDQQEWCRKLKGLARARSG